jgi:hypothetical protein
MSGRLISLSPDLARLRDEGYNIEVRGSAHLLVKDVPYLNNKREVKRGLLVTKLTLAGDITTERPKDHVAYFAGEAGEFPCNEDGTEIRIKNASSRIPLDSNLIVNYTLSARPKPEGNYTDYYDKMTHYVNIISGPAQQIRPGITARTHPLILTDQQDEETPFNYLDNASSRAEITLITRKLARAKVAIIGLGGTGSYVLDFLAKTPVAEIHLFDGDTFLQHNAFRAPGAPSIEDLRAKPTKVGYLKAIYSKMHRGIVAHEYYIDGYNTEELRTMDFVFLCVDRGTDKRILVERLQQFGRAFIDVGMGIFANESAIGGLLRVTTSTPLKRDHFSTRVSLADAPDDNEYANRIQIAELNALNAALAIIKWKKLLSFYHDFEHENNSLFTIDGNDLHNDDTCP